MPDYRVFGGVLRSEVEIPELQPVHGEAPTWVLHAVPGPAPGDAVEHLGTDVVYADVQVRMYRRQCGFRLEFDDTGCFDISSDGATLHWYHEVDVLVENARADLTSRVLAAALHARGILCLHGSAVAFNGQAIGLIAPKFHGKSTLALALVAAGARLLTDDTLPVTPGPPASASPGLHASRLWGDAAAWVGLGGQATLEGEKQIFSAFGEESVEHHNCNLAAIYLLTPERDSGQKQSAWRRRIPPTHAALALIAQAKLAPMLRKTEAGVLFHRAIRLAREVPVYRLHIVRDLARLNAVVSVIRSWHASEPLAAAAL